MNAREGKQENKPSLTEEDMLQLKANINHFLISSLKLMLPNQAAVKNVLNTNYCFTLSLIVFGTVLSKASGII